MFLVVEEFGDDKKMSLTLVSQRIMNLIRVRRSLAWASEEAPLTDNYFFRRNKSLRWTTKVTEAPFFKQLSLSLQQKRCDFVEKYVLISVANYLST